jgi:hypothetical protein
MALNCAPNVVSSDFTCFSLEDLKVIAAAYNKYIKRNDICNVRTKSCSLKKEIQIGNQTKSELWKEIQQRLFNVCKTESCWIDLDFINTIPNEHVKDTLRLYTFKPPATKTKHAWLSTHDINNVLRQYERFDPSFKFFGALPSDFYRFVNIKKSDIIKHKKVGFVLNHDKHNQDGSHWVALFIDNTSKSIEYFDSSGSPPIKRIKYFINTLGKMLKIYSYMENERVHQKHNSECGVYSIHYIIQRILGKTFEQVSQNPIRDSQMNKYRQFIFRQKE